ncbi:MAG: hypothetical protein RLZZ385_2534 [Pseudomonadota bacterium]|jgi:sec-independent protein translocase protein TatB
MFQVGPFELLLIFIVALLVIGPERLPGAVKTAGLWVGRFRRSFHKIKAEIEQELNADEIRRQLHNESIMEELESVKKQTNSIAGELTADLKDTAKAVEDIGKEAQDASRNAQQELSKADAETGEQVSPKNNLG